MTCQETSLLYSSAVTLTSEETIGARGGSGGECGGGGGEGGCGGGEGGCGGGGEGGDALHQRHAAPLAQADAQAEGQSVG